jgi:hypothetical protein
MIPASDAAAATAKDAEAAAGTVKVNNNDPIHCLYERGVHMKVNIWRPPASAMVTRAQLLLALELPSA